MSLWFDTKFTIPHYPSFLTNFPYSSKIITSTLAITSS